MNKMKGKKLLIATTEILPRNVGAELGGNAPAGVIWPRGRGLPHAVVAAHNLQSRELEVFLNFFNSKKWFFAFFSKLTWLGVGFVSRTGAEIGC